MPADEQVVAAALNAAKQADQGDPDLDGLAATAVADEQHRYELNREGEVSVAPVGDPPTALIVSRLVLWLASHGLGPDRLAVHMGIALDSAVVLVPTLTVWADGMLPRSAGSVGYAVPDGLQVVAEVMAADGEMAARLTEYAAAGIPQAWVVEPGPDVVYRYVLDTVSGRYEPAPGGEQALSLFLAGEPKIG